MKYSALIGNPTSHSVSPLLYNQLIQSIAFPEFYQHIRIDVPYGELKQAFDAFRTLRFVGLSVTLPYKLEIMQYLEKLDFVAKEIGDVNTVKLRETTTGYNTDWVGIAESVRRYGRSGAYDTATVFGTGGAARAAIYACKHLGVRTYPCPL